MIEKSDQQESIDWDDLFRTPVAGIGEKSGSDVRKRGDRRNRPASGMVSEWGDGCRNRAAKDDAMSKSEKVMGLIPKPADGTGSGCEKD